MSITMLSVKSSQIEAVGYDAVSKTLAIRFKGGSVYHYANVPEGLYDDMIHSESVGSFFYKRVKPLANLYPYTKQSAKTEKGSSV